jgi:hypothetical protein
LALDEIGWLFQLPDKGGDDFRVAADDDGISILPSPPLDNLPRALSMPYSGHVLEGVGTVSENSEKVTTERTEITEKSTPAGANRDYGSLLVDECFSSASSP